MKNVKDEVFAALLTVSEHLSDAYPKEWAGNEPTIQFTEEDNSVFEGSGSAEGMREDKSKVRYRIDIWDLKNTSPTAVAVDKVVSALGLKRIGCADVPDSSGMKHKQMRYEGIIDMDSDQVYWLN